MPRIVTVAAAQLGAIQKADTRQAVVARMLELMEQAKAKGADFIVYPELALTTFFPRWYHEDRAEADFWFEKEMPNAATRPLFERAAKHGMGMSFGYAELTPGRAPLQHLDPGRPEGRHRRQVPQGASAWSCRVRQGAHAPASGEALFRAGRPGLSGVALHGRHLRHVHLQ